MSRKFRLAFLVIVAAQVFLLLGLIGDREYTLRRGTEVVLETVPIDPRSLFQGDYAILDYKISRLPSNSRVPVRRAMYVRLREAGEVWEAWNYTSTKPSDREAVFIKGVVDRPGHRTPRRGIPECKGGGLGGRARQSRDQGRAAGWCAL